MGAVALANATPRDTMLDVSGRRPAFIRSNQTPPRGGACLSGRARTHTPGGLDSHLIMLPLDEWDAEYAV